MKIICNKDRSFTGIEIKCRYCTADSLDKTLVEGKIVVCDELDAGLTPLADGAVGTVMQDSVFRDVAFGFPLPASYISLSDGSSVLTYLNSTRCSSLNFLGRNC